VRPIEVMRYQLRSHLPYGLGVMEMVQPFQEETTELHNYTMLNVFLANARIWAAKEGAVPEKLEIMPGSVVKVLGDDVRTGLVELKMSEVYPSAFQAQSAAIGLAERRVGTSGAAGMLAKGGSRTPGVTALSLLQQVNRRFVPAFDDMREKTAAAVRQALMRYRERLLAKDAAVEDHIRMTMGVERAQLIEDVLTTTDFTRWVAVEMTASSAQVNREADRQNTVLVANLMGSYYEKTAALALQAATQPMPPELRQVLLDVAKKGTELMDRTLRTFDNVRDPQTFLLDLTKLEATINAGDAAQAQAQAQAMAAQAVAGLGQPPPAALPSPTQGPMAPPAPGVASAGGEPFGG
jgi:hypothetical protein